MAPPLDKLACLRAAAALEASALELEAGGRPQDAFCEYLGALDRLRAVYSCEGNPRVKSAVGGRIEELLVRAEALQAAGCKDVRQSESFVPARAREGGPAEEAAPATSSDAPLARLLAMGFEPLAAARALREAGASGLEAALRLLVEGAGAGGGAAASGAACPSAREVSKQAFEAAAAALVPIAGSGYPAAIRSTLSVRNELLRKHLGNVEAAVREALDKEAEFAAEARCFLLVLVPDVGIPAAVAYSLWRQLRVACLLASLHGHDLRSPAVQARVLCAACGAQAAASLARAGLAGAAEALWGQVARRVPGARALGALPVVGVVLALGQIRDMGADGMVREFQGGRAYLPPSAYSAELDPEPSLEGLLDLVREVGGQTLAQVADRGAALARSASAGAQDLGGPGARSCEDLWGHALRLAGVRVP